MRFRVWFTAAVAVSVSLSCAAHAATTTAQAPAPSAAQAHPTAAAPAKPDTAKPGLPWKPWAEVTKDAQVVRGLFTGYLKRDNVYLALKPDQLDKDYLLVTQLSQGIGDFGIDGGSSMRSDLIRFHRQGDKVELWVMNPYFTAPAGSAMARTVAYSFGNSVAQAFPIASIRDTTNELMIDVAPFIISDWVDVGGYFDFIIQALQLRGSASFDRERSSFQSLRGFPTNVELEARVTYRASRNLGINTLADYRYIPIGVHYSLLELPATPMQPRNADDRVGYFISAMMNLERDTSESFFVRYINRWRLEKKEPIAAVSEPVKPIVYYLDRTIPDEWRPYVRAGILEWNRAFEEAGFKNAVQVLDAPADTLWAAEDARYSTVRWMANFFSTYAIGPSDVDPRTGEILNADILVAASWIQAFQGDYREYAGPQTMIGRMFREDSLLRADPNGRGRMLCTYAEGMTRAATLLRASLAAAGIIKAGEPVPREYIGQALKELVMHEVGHTLGLRHNFRGTATIPANRLGDRTYTASHGTSGSVMDYNPPAIALDRSKQGDYYSTTIGTYDRWAIRYGYADVVASAGTNGEKAMTAGTVSPDDERVGLSRLAGLAADPDHLYGSDEDAAFGGFGLDPTTTRYDQTADPLGWAREHVQLVNRLFDSLDTRMMAPGDGYPKLRRAFTDLLFERYFPTIVATKYIGGATTSRDHRGDPGARPAFTDVPAARQREALQFLAREALGENVYRFNPSLLNSLAPSRWWHWGQNPFAEDRIDYPLHEWALAFQSTVVQLVTDPMVLERIRDAELRAPAGSSVLTIPELLNTLTGAIWAEAGYSGTARSARSIRRDIQRWYLTRMTRMIVSPQLGTPEDARSVARATLTDLSGRLDRALAGTNLDAYTRAHYSDSRQRIRQALNASVVQAAGAVR